MHSGSMLKYILPYAEKYQLPRGLGQKAGLRKVILDLSIFISFTMFMRPKKVEIAVHDYYNSGIISFKVN